MDELTAEQAAEAAKGLTFEKVWAIVIQTQKMMQDSQAAIQKQTEDSKKLMDESQKRSEELRKELSEKTEKLIADSQRSIADSQRSIAESRRSIAESQRNMADSQRKTEKIVADLSKNIGGLGNTFGRFTEAMFAADLWKKFNELGYTFTKQAPRMKFYENGQVLAEADFFLEDGMYAMPVEIKTELSLSDVDDHLVRIGKIRHYMDTRNDERKLIGAVAGGIVSENVLHYAQRKGLFVIQQTGDSVAIASMPEGFKAREW